LRQRYCEVRGNEKITGDTLYSAHFWRGYKEEEPLSQYIALVGGNNAGKGRGVLKIINNKSKESRKKLLFKI